VTWIIDAVRALSDLPLGALAAWAGLLAFAESGLGLGTLFPGETAVLVLGSAATTPSRFAGVLAAVTLGCMAGDHVSYGLGRHFGDRLRRTRLVRRFGQHHWDRAVAALRRHGAAAVFLTRLVPVARTLVPAAAGVSRLSYPRFLFASLAAGLLWATVYVGIGAFAGASAQYVERLVGRIGWAVLIVLCAALVIGGVLRGRSANRRGERPTAERDSIPIATTTDRVGHTDG